MYKLILQCMSKLFINYLCKLKKLSTIIIVYNATYVFNICSIYRPVHVAINIDNKDTCCLINH